MKTEKLTTTQAAASLLVAGKLVAFPTETVFGLGADATCPRALARLFEAKGRPSDNPLIVHLGDIAHWRLAARDMPPHAQRLFEAFSPGPLTVVLPKIPTISDLATAGLDSVGIRVPGCEVAQDMLRRANLPIAAPSANRSGRPSCTRWESVWEDLQGRIDAVLCLNTTHIGLESTVVDCCGAVPVMLRPGAITLEHLRAVIPETRAIDLTNTLPNAATEIHPKHRSPGLLHPHYRPMAIVRLWDQNDPGEAHGESDLAKTAYGGLARHPAATKLLSHHQFASLAEYAEGFYELMRAADRQGAQVIVLELSPESGIGIALRDRQLRAAGLL